MGTKEEQLGLEQLELEQLLEGFSLSEEEVQKKIKQINEAFPGVAINRVCSYGRVSTKSEEQESSLFTQRMLFKNYCDRHLKDGFILVREVYERHSATMISKREKFLDMINRAKQGEFNILLFKDSKRFSRNSEDFLGLVEELKRQRIYMIFINENVNTKTAERYMLQMLGVMAESHSNGLHESVSIAYKINAMRTEGRVPNIVYGYDHPKQGSKVLNINEREAEIVKEIFRRYTSGEGTSNICNDLRERGIKSKYGNDFSNIGLRNILKNKIYKGVLEMNREHREDVRANRSFLSEDEYIIRQREDLRIIDDDTFDLAQTILKSRRKGSDEPVKAIRRRFMSGVIQCEECGKYFCINKYGKKESQREYYKCTTHRYGREIAVVNQCSNDVSYRKEELQECLTQYFIQILNGKENIEKLVLDRLDKMIKENSNIEEDLNAKVEIKKARERYERAKELYIDGEIDKTRLNKIKHKYEKLIALDSKNSIVKLDKSEYVKRLKDVFNNVESFVRNGMNEDTLDTVKFNSMFKSVISHKDGSLDIVLGLPSCCSSGINHQAGFTLNYNKCLVDIGSLFDWEKININMNSIRGSSHRNRAMFRNSERFKSLGIQWKDNIYIMI